MPTENPLHDWLASLTGSLQTDQPTNESTAQIEELFKHLSLALPSSFQISDTRLPQFAFEKIQPSTIASLHPDIREKVLQLSGQEGIRDNEFKVFMRESPVRDVNALRSTPSWASGAAVDRTFGPFLNVDGRRVWFDFFKVEKLVALYNNAGSFPALLFNVTVSKLWSQENTALLASAQQEYNLTADSSIWILSTLLAANAPAGKYTGLTIKSGTISVNEMPVINAGKTTVSATAVVTVKLKLRQQEVTDADPTSPFGEDARAAEYTLPDMLEFHFSAAAGSKTDAIGNSQSLIFGQTIMYEWVGTPGNYNKDIAQLGYPLKASESEVIINKSASPFTQFSGRAKLLIPYWGLPIADLDLAHISPAAGIGGIGLICDKGLSATWTGLQHGPVALNLVLIGAQPGVVGLATGLAGNLYSKQTFTMWYDDVEDKIPTLISRPKKYPSTVSIDFGKQFKFQFFSTANGNELLEANVNANVDADRPIDVSARPISIHTKDSSFLLMANKNFKAVLLYDNNIIADNFTVDPNNPQSAFDLKTMSLALENALFTTSEVNGVFLSGELDDDWKKINKGLLFTAFAVYKYIPTLPDPYAANVGIFQKFIDFRVTDNITIKVPVMVLLCQVKFNVTAPEQPDFYGSFICWYLAFA